MITSPFTGNFGNHLISYLITRIVADKNGYEFGFNPIAEFDYYGGNSQFYFLDLDFGKTHLYKYSEIPDWAENIWEEKFNKYFYPSGDMVEYHYFQPDVFDIIDNTKLIIRCCQDARYFNDYKEKIKSWLHIKENYAQEYKQTLDEHNIVLDDNLCILNIRGGEYKGVPQLLLKKEYWINAIKRMLNKNSNMSFLAVSDDPEYVKILFDNVIPVIHIGIGGDYYILNNAKNLIISNSSFAIMPVWLNENNPYVISPKFWARWNIFTGYWANSDVYTFGWNFMDKKGNLDTYASN